MDRVCFVSPALLILESLPDSLFALNTMKILHRSSEFNHHRQTEENDRHIFIVLLFGSKTVKRAHRSGMFTQFEVGQSARTALAALSLRMLASKTFNGLQNLPHVLNRSSFHAVHG